MQIRRDAYCLTTSDSCCAGRLVSQVKRQVNVQVPAPERLGQVFQCRMICLSRYNLAGPAYSSSGLDSWVEVLKASQAPFISCFSNDCCNAVQPSNQAKSSAQKLYPMFRPKRERKVSCRLADYCEPCCQLCCSHS